MTVVKVPRTPKSSFNKDRKPSALLLDQIKHLEWAVLPAAQRKPKALARHPKVKSEAQAAERIAQLTTMVLHAKTVEPNGPPADGVQLKITLPPLPRAPKARRATKERPKSRRR